MSEKTYITGKECALEESIEHMQELLQRAGFAIEEARWLNPVANVWCVHIRDRRYPLLFTNGKGASRKAALASALGEFHERLATNYFFADFYLGQDGDFSHYPGERWFQAEPGRWPQGLLQDERLRKFYGLGGELDPAALIDRNSHRTVAVCALLYERLRDGETLWFPINLVANLYVSNGMSAGNIDEQPPLHEFLGLAADPGSALASLRIGELKALLLLGTDRRQETVDWLEWLGDFGELEGDRIRGYQCLLHILRLEQQDEAWESYGNVLASIFGERAWQRAVSLYLGENLFDGSISPTARSAASSTGGRWTSTGAYRN